MKYTEPNEQVELALIVWNESNYIKDSPYIELSPNMRLFYTPSKHGPGNGFTFCVVEFCFASVDDNDDVWQTPDVAVEIICHGTALFDGIRHLYMPYINYPELESLAQLFVALNKLVHQFCDSPN